MFSEMGYCMFYLYSILPIEKTVVIIEYSLEMGFVIIFRSIVIELFSVAFRISVDEAQLHYV